METLTLTHWKKEYNYDYLGAYSLPTDGTDLVFTIKETRKEKVKNVKGESEDCFVLYFSERDSKPMILNKTNAKTIQKVYGTPYIEQWTGKQIQLYSTTVNAFGTQTDALRIRDFKPQIKQLDISGATAKLNAAASLEELAAAYKGLSREEQYNPEIRALSNTLKSKFNDKV